jgi:hypothetical protein
MKEAMSGVQVKGIRKPETNINWQSRRIGIRDK